MSKTTFEKLGIPYEERDGIFYPVLVAGTEKADIDVGKYGRMWIKYIKEEYPMRYKSLVRFGELEELSLIHIYILSCIVQSISKVSGTTFFHMCVSTIQMSRLICRWRKTGIS